MKLRGMKTTISRPLATAAAVFALCWAAVGCDFTEVADLTEPGRVQIFLRYEMPPDYPVQPGDSLFVVTRDFRLYRDTTFADVYQHPDQYMFRNDSLVSVNLLDKSNENGLIQIAHGSVAPLEYDRLVFEMSPQNWVKISGKRYPLRRAGEGASTVFELNEHLPVRDNQTTKIYLTLAVHRVLYRLADEFVFLARADSTAIEGAPS